MITNPPLLLFPVFYRIVYAHVSLCPDPVLPGHCVGDVPFLLQALWPQPAGPVGSLIPRKPLQPNEGACKQLMNFVYVHSLTGQY